MAKLRSKSYILNREKYKAIKKYDHQQMEDFCSSIYESGYNSGYKKGYANGCDTAVASSVGLEEFLQAAAGVKGIGQKKLEEIRSCIEMRKNIKPVILKEDDEDINS